MASTVVTASDIEASAMSDRFRVRVAFGFGLCFIPKKFLKLLIRNNTAGGKDDKSEQMEKDKHFDSDCSDGCNRLKGCQWCVVLT